MDFAIASTLTTTLAPPTYPPSGHSIATSTSRYKGNSCMHRMGCLEPTTQDCLCPSVCRCVKRPVFECEDRGAHKLAEAESTCCCPETVKSKGKSRTERAERIAIQGVQPLSTPHSDDSVEFSRRKAMTRYHALLAKNKQLKRRKHCRLCKERSVNVTLLPCGHFVYCLDCAQTLSHCGICGREIMADVKTFLS